MQSQTRGQRFLNRLNVLGNDILDQGQGALQTSQQILRGVGSNLSRFFKGISNTVIGSLDAGQSVGSFGDSLQHFSKGKFKEGAGALGDSIYYGAKGLLGSTAGVTQTSSSLVPIGIMGGSGLLAYGLYRALKNSSVGKAMQGDFDQLADNLLEKTKKVTQKGIGLGIDKIKKIHKNSYENYKKSKKSKKTNDKQNVPILTGQAQTLMF